MKRLSILFLLTTVCTAVIGQSGLTTLPGIPAQGRYDDIFFINDSTGWVCGGYGFPDKGRIFRTDDGGNTWRQQFGAGKYLRSIKFATDKIGFCGSLDSTLYKTTDGGQTWVDITASLPIRPKGICGLSIPNPSVVYGVGKYSGPAFIIKSLDGGNTWQYINMSAYAAGLVDVLFLNKDTGYVSGTSLQGGVLLYTTDGGSSWTTKYRTGFAGEYIWKIQTPDYKTFFASVDGLPTNNCRFLKSTDRGQNWERFFAFTRPVYIQGIGFVDDKTGWMGGDDKLYKTTDGGATWAAEVFRGPSFNRFYRINSKVAFLSGERVYRYNALTDGNNGNTKPDPVHYLQPLPNPVKDVLKIQMVFRYATYAMLTLYNAAGMQVTQLMSQDVQGGSKTIGFDMRNLTAGTYYVTLRTNEGVIHKAVVKL